MNKTELDIRPVVCGSEKGGADGKFVPCVVCTKEVYRTESSTITGRLDDNGKLESLYETGRVVVKLVPVCLQCATIMWASCQALREKGFELPSQQAPINY